MGRDGWAVHHDREIPREAFMHRIGEIEMAVKAGKMSSEEGARAVESTKRAMEEATRVSEGDAKTLSRADYARGEEQIKELVAEGKVSKEDAEHRLDEMRKAMGSGRRGMVTKGVEPRFIPEEEYNRVAAELERPIFE